MSQKHIQASLRVEGDAIAEAHDAVVVFIDHQHARLVFLDGIDLEQASFAQVRLIEPHRRFRLSDRSEGARSGKAHPDETAFYDAVIAAIGKCTRAIVVGPGTAPRALLSRAEANDPSSIEGRLVGVERSDRLTDAQLVALGRARFPIAGGHPPPRGR
ncbi:MAG: hypothetical protein FGM39_04150 [Phycisphaerales bacterium]|nr:hypothetical protein [Phycisphaerales bacterium]